MNDDEDLLYLCFTDSPSSREAGRASLRRIARCLEAAAPDTGTRDPPPEKPEKQSRP